MVFRSDRSAGGDGERLALELALAERACSRDQEQYLQHAYGQNPQWENSGIHV